MIGQTVRLYGEGVRDARAGRRRDRLAGESQHNRATYLLGYEDECARMIDARLLPQEEFGIEWAPIPSPAPGVRPRGRPRKRRRHVPAPQGDLFDHDTVGP